MGAGSKHSRRKAEIRAASVIAPVVQMEQRREERSMYGRDAPPATLQKWRGEAWGTYSWADIVGIMQSAEIAGATETWARLTRRMYQDGHILAVRGTRIDPIASADFDVSPGGQDPIDAQAAADVEAMLRGLPDLPTTLDAVLDAEFVGWSVEEIIWGVRGAWVWPEQIDILEPHRFRFDAFIRPYLYDDGRLGTDPTSNPQIRLVGKALRENKYIVHMPRVIPDYPIASGLLRGVVRYWWVKWMAAQYWLNGAEVAGNPRAIGKYPQEAADNVKQAFFDQLQQLSASGVMVMSKDNELEIVAAGAQGTGGVWSGIQAWCDDGITKTVLGSTLNTSVGDSGSRALGESQGERTIDPRLKKSSAAMWATITRDLVRPFLEFNTWNYGGRMPKLPVIKSRFGEEMEPKPDADLIDVGGVTIDELRRVAGLPEWGPERGGDRIAERKAAPMGAAFGGLAGGLGLAPAETTYASGGTPPASPFKPWDLVEKMSREAE